MKKADIKPKRILFTHSAGSQDGSGEGSFDLVSTLKTELSDEYNIQYPIIDDPDAPTYQAWKKLLDSVLEKNMEPLILIGHSLGGSVLLKYLSEEEVDISIAGLFLISIPLWGTEGWNVDEFVLPDNFEAKLGLSSNVYLYHSRGDETVPFEHLNFYKNAFPYATVRELEGKDHAFAGGLPELISDIKSI